MAYVDGFVLAVKTDKVEAYREMAEKAGRIWMQHGALSFRESKGEDLAGNGFCGTFPDNFDVKDDETVFFSYITFKSRAHRDEVNAKVMADDSMKDCGDPENMPFDVKRMAYGGFETIVDF